ncbi:MAG: MMPL family transporter [Pseudomonadota bacterium]
MSSVAESGEQKQARWRYAALIVMLILLSLAGSKILLSHMTINRAATLEQMLAPEDLAALQGLRDLFEVNSEPILIALESEKELAVGRIDALESALAAVPGVEQTFSWTASASVVAESAILGKKLELPANTALFLVLPVSDSLQHDEVLRLVNGIGKGLGRPANPALFADEQLTIVGLPQVRAASWQIISDEAQITLPLLVSVTALLTYAFFGSWAALGLTLTLTSITTLLCLTLQFFLDPNIRALTVFAVSVIWAIATLDGFHLLSRTHLERSRGQNEPELIAARALFFPCLLTTLTTIGGFLPLVLLDTSPLVASFGLWGIAGTAIAFLLTFTLGVALLRWCNLGRDMPRWPARLAVKLVTVAQERDRTVVLCWVTAALVSLAALPRLTVLASPLQVFSADQPLAQDIRRLQTLTQSDLSPIEVVIHPTNRHGEAEANMVAAAVFTGNYLQTIDETRFILPIDLLDGRQTGANAENGSTAYRPEDQTEAEAGSDQRLHETRIWRSADGRALRLTCYFKSTSFARKEEIVSWLRKFDRSSLPHHSLSLSGSGYLAHNTEQLGLKNLAMSAICSFCVLAATMILVTRSSVGTLGALAGSLVPLLATAGWMGYTEVVWSVALLPIPALLFGLTNDDTIHLLYQKSRSPGVQWRRNARRAAPALLATSAVLAATVAMLATSGLQSTRQLGLFLPFGLLVAILCNLTLLPALSSWKRRSSLSKRSE